MDKKKIQAMQADMLAALESVAKKHSVEFQFKSSTFGDFEWLAKMSVTDIDAQALAKAEDVRKTTFKVYSRRFGYDPSIFGKSFSFRGETRTIVGVEPKRKKFPIITKNSDGSESLFTVEAVNAYLTSGTKQ